MGAVQRDILKCMLRQCAHSVDTVYGHRTQDRHECDFVNMNACGCTYVSLCVVYGAGATYMRHI